MLNKIDEGMELAYESMNKKSMTVGTVKPGDLEGKTKEKGPSKSGAENTDVPCAKDAPSELQGDTVEGSKKKTKGTSKFDELFSRVVKEDAAPTIEDSSFDSDTGDFPPAGGDEAEAELGAEPDMEASEGDAFSQLADLFSKAAELFSQMASEHGGAEDMLGDEPTLGEDEEVATEDVEMEKAPEAVSKVTAKGHMDAKGVTVSRGTAINKGSGAKDGGKPKVAKDTTLGPNTPLKANGSGAIADGKSSNFFG